MPEHLVTQVVPKAFEGKTEYDAAVYSLYLLGLIDELNEDRATVFKAIQVHNQK